jgi:probable HAF family extracellular repeat protein
MRTASVRWRVAALVAMAPLVAALQTSPVAAVPTRLAIVDLGALAGGCCSFAEAINNRGEVVGTSDVGDTISHAFVWREGVMSDLGTLGGTSSVGQDVNDRGEVVGYSTLAGSFDLHAFLWRDGEMSDLGTLGGRDSYAVGINNRGDVVGFSTTAADEMHAFRWRNGTMTDLGGGTTALAYGVNDRGSVVGFADSGPAIWRRGVARSLDLPAGATYGSAFAVNSRGDVAGYSGFPSGFSINRATLWRGGVPSDLGTLGGADSQASGINRRGQVVGSSDTAAGGGEAFLWEHGRMRGLGGLAAGLGSEATDINDRGQVVGNASTTVEGFVHATLWR